MANVKGRVKAPKSATRGRGRRNSKQSLTGTKDTSSLTKNVTENPGIFFSLPMPENKARPRRPGDITALQHVLMQNEGIDFNKCTEKILKLNTPKLPKKRIRKKIMKQPKPVKLPRFVSKSGRIVGPRTKKGLKMIDNILKGELMIEIELPSKKIEKTSIKTINNNNEIGINDQNDTYHGVPIFHYPKENKQKQKGKSKNKTKICETTTNNKVETESVRGYQTRSKPFVPISIDITKRRSSKPKAPPSKTPSKIKNSSPEINKKASLSKTVQENVINKKPKLNEKIVKTKQVTLSNGLVLTLALFQCDYCQKMFSSKASLRRHMYTHLKLQPHRCKKCSKKFRYKMHLQNHINKHHNNIKNVAPNLCQICDKEFILEENLELHLSTHIKNENSFKCVYCDKQFSYHLLLTQHEKQHLLKGKYQCSVCKLSFVSINRLKIHMKTHLKIKDYICQHCGKEFFRMNSLRRHVQICHSGHRLQCPICNKKLKGHLTEHMRTHKQARPHECDLCGQRFTQSTQLTVHRRCHTGERPFGCKICNRQFTHSNSLMLHIRRHTGEKPFQCTVCPLSFSQLPHMKTHLIKIHKLDAPYRCTKCNTFFKMKKQFENHAKTCKVGERELTFEEKIQASVQVDQVHIDTPMSLSRMRYLLALLLTMVANEQRLKFLGFNKRPIEELLLESVEAIGKKPCKDESLPPLKRLKTNIQTLLEGTIPAYQMEKFKKEHKTTEEILEILTDDKKKND